MRRGFVLLLLLLLSFLGGCRDRFWLAREHSWVVCVHDMSVGDESEQALISALRQYAQGAGDDEM